MTRVTAVVMLALALAGCSRLGGGDSYFPLQKGLSWTYELVYEGLEPSKETLTIRTLGNGPLWVKADEKVDAAIRQTSRGTDYYIEERDNGYFRVGKRIVIQHEAVADKEARLVLPKGRNLRVGYTWTVDSQPYAMRWMPPFIEANASLKPFDMVYEVAALGETVETPAGKFENCVRLDATGKMVFYADASAGYREIFINHSEWYAPGVGLVKLERVEPLETDILRGGTATLTLMRFSAK